MQGFSLLNFSNICWALLLKKYKLVCFVHPFPTITVGALMRRSIYVENNLWSCTLFWHFFSDVGCVFPLILLTSWADDILRFNAKHHIWSHRTNAWQSKEHDSSALALKWTILYFDSCDLFTLFSNMVAENLLNTCSLFQRRTNYVWSKASQALQKTKDELSLIVFISYVPDSEQSVGRECGQWFCGYLLHAATRYILLYDTLLPFTPDRFWLHRLFKPPESIQPHAPQ